MTLDEALHRLRAPTAPRAEVVQAVLVLLTRARQRLDSGDAEGAGELALAIERGLQALRVQVLTPLIDRARAVGTIDSRVNAAKVAIKVLDRIFASVMRGSPPLTPVRAESQTPREALAWLTTTALEVIADADLRTGPGQAPSWSEA